MKKYRFDGSREFDISSFDCSDKGAFSDRTEAEAELAENLEKISSLQQKLYAEKKEGVIFILQAMDAAGKDGTIDAVFGCLIGAALVLAGLAILLFFAFTALAKALVRLSRAVWRGIKRCFVGKKEEIRNE